MRDNKWSEFEGQHITKYHCYCTEIRLKNNKIVGKFLSSQSMCKPTGGSNNFENYNIDTFIELYKKYPKTACKICLKKISDGVKKAKLKLK